MEAHAIPHVREVVIFLIAAGIVVPLFHRFHVSPILGYLMIGGIVGPYGLGLFADRIEWLQYAVITDLAGVQALAELGVIFLLFMIGLELSLDRLWAMRRMVFGLGSLQILISAVVIGLIAWEFGNSPAASIVLGACLALSSTAIVMQLLIERRELASPLGRSSFSILLMQDLAVVPILFLVGVLGAKAGDSAGLGLALALALGKALAVIVGIYLGGRLLLRPLFNMVAHSRSAEMFMAATLLIIIVAALITGATGLSMALGAFLAGLLLAETEFRHQIEVDIEPFKGLLLGLFFMSVGMGIDYRVVADAAGWILASVIGMYVIKSVITASLCLIFGLPRHVSLEAGLLLGQGGEFAFVVVGLAMALGLIPPEAGQFMLIVTGLTMAVTPLVAITATRLSARMERALRRQATDANDPIHIGEMQGHVLVSGFGRVGCLIARILDADGIPFVALDNSAFNVAEARQMGLPVYFGDASRIELLRRAHAGNASMLVLTMDDPKAIEQVVQMVRAEWPGLRIIARARDARHAAHLLDLGATEVIQETLEAGLQLAGRVLQLAGTPEEVAHRRTEAQREEEMNALRELVG